MRSPGLLSPLFSCSLFFLGLLVLSTGCGATEDQDDSKPSEPSPPTPPILETFQTTPQLSLFPRLGDFRPDPEEERLPFWNTYREHLLKISGVLITDPATENRAFSFRGIKGIDSTGFFAPLAVEPETNYRLKLKLKTELSEKETTGVGLIEYRQFLWVAEQYTESLHLDYVLGVQELLRINRTEDWQDFEIDFKTGPQTRMIHLVFFREGPVNKRTQVMIDDISIAAE